jgi:hypothetical protein
MIWSDYISDDHSTGDGKENDESYVEHRESDSELAEDATWDDYCCIEVDATGNCFHWNGQDEVG